MEYAKKIKSGGQRHRQKTDYKTGDRMGLEREIHQIREYRRKAGIIRGLLNDSGVLGFWYCLCQADDDG